MKRLMFLALVLALGGDLRGAESGRFQELYDVLREHLAGATAESLDEAAVAGLVRQLSPRVMFAGETEATGGTNGLPLVTAEVLDQFYGYVRISRVTAGVAREFTNAVQQLLATNKLKGLVVDLRFAGGQDFASAVAVADQFFAGEQQLIDWGEGWKKSASKPEAITKPVALLVNRKTTGAAEALAGMLRLSDVGLLIGTNTAGQASKWREFPLKGGQCVRVAVAPVKVANDKELAASGLKPDITVEVAEEAEQLWYEDSSKVLPKPGRLAASGTNDSNLQTTNRPPRRRINEADLVRMRNEGLNPDTDPPSAAARKSDPSALIINDPALARAVDLLKGLALVQQFR